jgi:hypothetical protein
MSGWNLFASCRRGAAKRFLVISHVSQKIPRRCSMNKTSGADRARANRPGRKIVTAAGLLLAMSATLPGLSQAQTFTVVDTLSTAPGKTFSIFGTGGLAITTEQFVGPRFTLTQRAVLTRVGAFVNNCATITSGVPQCPNALPFVVQIRRSVNGAPDPRLVVAAAPTISPWRRARISQSSLPSRRVTAACCCPRHQVLSQASRQSAKFARAGAS